VDKDTVDMIKLTLALGFLIFMGACHCYACNNPAPESEYISPFETYPGQW